MAVHALCFWIDAFIYIDHDLYHVLIQYMERAISRHSRCSFFSVYGVLLNPQNIQNLLQLPDKLNYKARVLVGWISPLNHATFYMHNFGYDKLPTLGQTTWIGSILLAVLLALTMAAMRRYAFSFTGTEGK